MLFYFLRSLNFIFVAFGLIYLFGLLFLFQFILPILTFVCVSIHFTSYYIKFAHESNSIVQYNNLFIQILG